VWDPQCQREFVELPESYSCISLCLVIDLGFPRRFLKLVEVSLEKTRMEQKDVYPEKSPVQAHLNDSSESSTYAASEAFARL